MNFSDIQFALRKYLKRPRYRYMAVNRLVPHLPWFILIALSILLYKERVFADSGFYVSQFINNKMFWIECQRIVLAFSQILPLTAVWIGLELKYVLLLYSLSHVLFFYSLFLFVYYGLRDRRSGLLIVLFQVVGIMYSFFTPMFEMYYGVPLMITFYAIWKLNIRAGFIYFLLLLLEVLILLSHPLMFMLFPFLLLFDHNRRKARPVAMYLALLTVFVGVMILKRFTMCPYEAGKLAWQFDYSSNPQYRQFFNPGYWADMGLFFIRHYFEVVAGLIIVIVMFIRRKEWFRILLVVGTFTAYLFLVGSVYTLDHSRYMEQVLFPFVVIVFIPLIYGFPKEPNPGLKNISILLISGLIVYRLFMIYSGSELFTYRTRQMENLIHSARQKGGSKFILSEYNVDKGYTQLNWSYPLETVLLSSLDGSDLTVTIVPEEDYFFDGNDRKTGPMQFIFRRWEIKDYSWLNDTYFHLDPGDYRMLCDSNARQDLRLLQRHLKLSVDAGNFYQALDTIWVQVKISNSGPEPLKAGKGDQVFFSYFWMKDNDYLDWNGILTPLETDVVRSLSQDVRVAVPKTKGRLKLKVDIVTRDRMWFGINASDEVLVY